jgi:esterase/lipase superfamily enzyme
MTVAVQHGQPVALPPARRAWYRIEAHGATGRSVKKSQDVDGRRVIVVDVPVTRAREQVLLHDEDLMPDPEVDREFPGVRYGAGGQPAASGC